MTKLADIVKLDKNFWRLLGAGVVARIRTHTIKGGKDVYNRKFKRLTPEYKELKASHKLPRSESAKGRADLSLSGDMMSDLQPSKPTNHSITVGWPTESEKLVGNANMGRVVTTKKQPVADGVERYIQKEVDKRTEKNIKKNDTVNIIKLGK